MAQTRKKASPPPIVFILLGLALTFCTFKLAPIVQKSLSTKARGSEHISFGEQSLIPTEATAEKRSGTEAFASRD